MRIISGLLQLMFTGCIIYNVWMFAFHPLQGVRLVGYLARALVFLIALGIYTLFTRAMDNSRRARGIL